MERFVIDETTNTLVKCNHHMTPKRLDYLVIPFLCIEDCVKYLEDRACENAHILDVKLPRRLKIGERCFASSELMEILLPWDLHIINKETFLNCERLETIHAEFGVNTISYDAFKGCKNLK